MIKKVKSYLIICLCFSFLFGCIPFMPGDILDMTQYFNDVVPAWRCDFDSSDEEYNSEKGYSVKLVQGITLTSLTNGQDCIPFNNYLKLEFLAKNEYEDKLKCNGMIFIIKAEKPAEVKVMIKIDEIYESELTKIELENKSVTVNMDFSKNIYSKIELVVINPIELYDTKISIYSIVLRAEERD